MATRNKLRPGAPALATIAAGLVFAAVQFAGTPVPAMPGGSSSGGGGSKPACSSFTSKNTCQAQSHCYWSGSSNKCKTKQNQLHSGPDDALYWTARALVDEGKYEAALAKLRSIKQQDHPRVLNYIGYSTRKLGDVDKGIEYYHKALAIDPNYNVAREYLGEGYLQKGDLDSAKGQLVEIAKRCGTECEPYVKLANAIVEHVTGVKLGKDW